MTASVSVAEFSSSGSCADSCARRLMRSPLACCTRPWSGDSSPATILRRVVFPAPFGPTRPMRSPAATLSVTSSRMTAAPISRRTSLNVMMLMPPPLGAPNVDVLQHARCALHQPSLGSLAHSSGVRARRATPRPEPCRAADAGRYGRHGYRGPLRPNAELPHHNGDTVRRCADKHQDAPASRRRHLVPCSR